MNTGIKKFLYAALLVCACMGTSQAVETSTAAIAPQPLISALNEFVTRTGMQVVYRSELAAGIQSKGAESGLPPQKMLEQLLRDTGLAFEFVNPQTVTIRSGRAAPSRSSAGVTPRMNELHFARVDDAQQTPAKQAEKAQSKEDPATDEKGVPEILVKGNRSLNSDIRRTEDDTQPYVVFSGDQIRRSQAINLQEFLRTRLPMNTSSQSIAQTPGIPNTASGFNLRGLGENQTLILVDGRRLPGIVAGGSPTQADVNGIPLSAIERIEVLPSTAGGIYGGSATGGVINIIMRRDFRGVEVGGLYRNTFDTDAGSVQADLNTGFNFEGGRTQVLFSATYTRSNDLLHRDRDFGARGWELQKQNNISAITGSTTPPLGKTVNIRSSNGTPLTLKAGNRPLGFNITHLPLGYAGPASDNGQALINNAGRYNLDVPSGMQGMDRGLVGSPSKQSALLNARREFTPWLDVFVDLSWFGNKGHSYWAGLAGQLIPNTAALAATAPNNPFNQAITVRFAAPNMTDFDARMDNTTVRGTGGFIVRLPKAWVAELSHSWSRGTFESARTQGTVDSVASCVMNRGLPAGTDPDGAGPMTPCAVGDTRPALNMLQEFNTFPVDFGPYLLSTPTDAYGPGHNVLTDTVLRASGPLMKLPGGELRLAAMIEQRKEDMQDAVSEQADSITRGRRYIFLPSRRQDVDSASLEVTAPLTRKIDLTASMRRDSYMTQGSASAGGIVIPSRDGPFPSVVKTTGRAVATDHTIALSYAPVPDIKLRASVNSGFLPPSVSQVAPPGQGQGSFFGADPKRGFETTNGGVFATTFFGGNPNLRPELSDSWSAGIILTPRWMEGVRFSIDYLQIKKKDEIQSPSSQYLIDNEAAFADRIQRGARLLNDPVGYAGPVIRYDGTDINIADTKVESFDFRLDWIRTTERSGGFNFYAMATWEPHYYNRVLPGNPMVDSVGYTGGALEWKGNMGVDWDNGPWSASWNMQFYDSYRAYTVSTLPAARDLAALNQGSHFIPKQSYHDLLMSYRFEEVAGFAGGLLSNSELSFGIQNVLNTSPPILAVTAFWAQGGYSTYGDPLLRRYSVNFRKAFGN